MTASAPVHLILDEPPHSGTWNMAVDAAMLEESLGSGVAFVRMYRWAEPTISLGYFQNPEEYQASSRFGHLPFVRRLSGGGAILHDREQTYSCILPPGHFLAEQPSRLYDLIHSTVIKLLQEHGIHVQARGRDSKNGPEPFLCFLREASPDLVVQGHKILGSAQRRRRGAVLQHGSLLLRASEHALELPGLTDLIATFQWSPNDAEELGRQIAQAIGDSCVVGKLPETVLSAAQTMLSSRITTELPSRQFA
jgi:lipoate-protein ligase A